MAKAFWRALTATLLVIIGIKWLTGIAFLPLLLLALAILAMALGLFLRLDRAQRRA